MPSLAGKPPFATDEPDSYYESSDPTPRRRAPPANPHQPSRTSAYDVYDNYLSTDSQNPRSSGVGAAFMNGDMDSDSEDEDDAHSRKPMDPHHAPVSVHLPEPEPTRLTATGDNTRQANIAAPKPGYAAPISALNNAAQPNRHVPPGIQVPSAHAVIPGSPSPTSPHPLQAPITPIQPVFARPRPPKETEVKFAGEIMRGEKESGILPKRGEKGDDFWRRFSMVVKDESSKREKISPWLRKTQSGTTSWTRWIWVVALILVVAAAGGIGIGWYLSHQGPDSYQPTPIGGSANEVAVSSVKHVGSDATATARSSFLVQPTNTVDRRGEPTSSPEAVKIRRTIPARMVAREPVPQPQPVAVDETALYARVGAKVPRRMHGSLQH